MYDTGEGVNATTSEAEVSMTMAQLIQPDTSHEDTMNQLVYEMNVLLTESCCRSWQNTH